MGETERDDATLEALLEQARAAGPRTRINYRDPIAAHGVDGTRAVEPWVSDPVLGAFAVRVIARVGRVERTEASETLRRARSTAGTASIGRDIDEALSVLAPGAPTRKGSDPWRQAAIPATAGLEWPGFQPHEFGRIAGTAWRSRGGAVSLAPIITTALRYKHPYFRSYPVERSPELHFALRPRYEEGGEHGQGWRAAKIVVYAHGPTGETPPDRPRVVTAGLYVEKGDGSERFGAVDDRWDWPYLLRALRDESVRRDELARLMLAHEMRIGDYIGGRFSSLGAAVGFTGAFDDGRLVLRDREGASIGGSLDTVVELLEDLPDAAWADLHLWRSWPADEAIAAERSFAFDALIPLLADLTGLYLDIVGPVLPRPG